MLALNPMTHDEREFARALHHQAYREVVLKQFGSWDESLQDNFFSQAWHKAPHFSVTWDGNLVGYASIEIQPTRTILHELVIQPNCQNRGIATAVILKLQTDAAARAASIALQVLRENRATALYVRLGFKLTGETETHLEMAWST